MAGKPQPQPELMDTLKTFDGILGNDSLKELGARAAGIDSFCFDSLSIVYFDNAIFVKLLNQYNYCT